jgi:hypothetical protein
VITAAEVHLIKSLSICIKYFALSFIKHSWSNGRIIAFQAIGPGSTPGGCTTSFSSIATRCGFLFGGFWFSGGDSEGSRVDQHHTTPHHGPTIIFEHTWYMINAVNGNIPIYLFVLLFMNVLFSELQWAMS